MVNKELVKNLVVALVSAGVGATVAWYVASEKYHREAHEQIQEVKDYYSKIENCDQWHVIREEDTDDKEVEGEENSEKAEENQSSGEEDYREQLRDYGSPHISADRPDEMPSTPYNHKFTRPDRDPIFIIPKEVFYSDEDDFEKESLTWYAGDDVMVDFHDNVITDYVDVVGDDFSDAFVKDGQTRNCWVRNERHQVDYEIELNENDYTEIVLGFTPEKDDILKFRDED